MNSNLRVLVPYPRVWQVLIFSLPPLLSTSCGQEGRATVRDKRGEAHIVRPKQPTELSDDQWAEFLFMRKNIKGVQFERWNHSHGCRKWFNVVRDTSNDKIHSVYKMGEKPPVK